jgi:hypothetical protein
MPWEDGTLTADDVALHVDAPVDDRMIRAVETARAWAQRRRSNTLPIALWSDPTAHDGGTRYAGLLWRSKAAPIGFASYEPQDAADYTEFARAADHVGTDPVIS